MFPVENVVFSFGVRPRIFCHSRAFSVPGIAGNRFHCFFPVRPLLSRSRPRSVLLRWPEIVNFNPTLPMMITSIHIMTFTSKTNPLSPSFSPGFPFKILATFRKSSSLIRVHSGLPRLFRFFRRPANASMQLYINQAPLASAIAYLGKVTSSSFT